MKKSFYTEEFYSNPIITLDILNKLEKEKCVADKDMYQNGDFLFMEVYDNDKTREILSPIISDFSSYINYNNDTFVSNEASQLGLCALQDDHFKNFDLDNKIIWDAENEQFVFAVMLEEED